jgi:hypothetical protein
MKCENTVKIGDVVKSLDFVGHDDCYMVGLVTAVLSDGTFRAKTIKRVWLGQVDKRFKSDTFVAPLPGHHFMDDMMFPRVQVVA